MTKIKLVKIDEDAHKRAKIAAAKAGTSMQDWLSTMIRRWTKQQQG
jgi:predicted HicB family RNase H-like nuclease